MKLVRMNDSTVVSGYKLDFEEKSNHYIASVQSPQGDIYEVQFQKPYTGKPLNCTCTGYKYRRSCKHLELAKILMDGSNLVTAKATGSGRLFTEAELRKLAEGRFLRKDCVVLVKELDKTVLKGMDYVVSGSYRREKSSCKDLDVLVKNTGPLRSLLLERLTDKYPGGDGKRDKDQRRRGQGEYIIQWYCPLDGREIMLDFHLIDPADFEMELLFFTGSAEFNVGMRAMAKKMGYALNQHGLYEASTKKLITNEESEVFKVLGIHYVSPNKRENWPFGSVKREWLK